MSRFLNRSLKALTPYVPGEQPRGEERLIKLNTNESPFPPSPLVLDALSRAEAEKLRLYPDPTCRAAAEAIAREVGVSPAQVVLGNGSDELLAFAFHGFCENGGSIACSARCSTSKHASCPCGRIIPCAWRITLAAGRRCSWPTRMRPRACRCP